MSGRGELNTLHEGHAAFHTRLDEHSGEHGAARERGLQSVDAEFRGELHGGRTPTISPRQDIT